MKTQKKVKILKIFQCTFVLRVLKPNHLVRVLFITMQAFVSPMVTSTFDHGWSPKLSPSIFRRVPPFIGPLVGNIYNEGRYIIFISETVKPFFKSDAYVYQIACHNGDGNTWLQLYFLESFWCKEKKLPK